LFVYARGEKGEVKLGEENERQMIYTVTGRKTVGCVESFAQENGHICNYS
jgi:hypothetical protein